MLNGWLIAVVGEDVFVVGSRRCALGRVPESALQERGLSWNAGTQPDAGQHPVLARTLLPFREWRSSAGIHR